MDVLFKCAGITQQVEALPVHDKLCPGLAPHAERDFATVVLKFDRAAMRRKSTGERLHNAFVGQRFAEVSRIHDGCAIAWKHVNHPSETLVVNVNGDG